MADVVDSPTPSDALVVAKDGRLYFERFDENGNVTATRAASPRDALVYLQNLIAFSDSGVPAPSVQISGEGYDKSNVATMSRDQLVSVARHLLTQIAAQVARDNPAASIEAREAIFADIVKGAVRDSRAIDIVVDALGRNSSLQIKIWPDLGAVTPLPEDPAAEWESPDFAAGGGRAMSGTTATGPGGAAAADPGVSVASGGAATSPSHAADPVLPFTGQFHIEGTDLAVDGIGLNIEFTRTYLHAVRYNGPLGPRWDHTYNLWLREAMEPALDGGYEHVVYRSSGTLRVDRFRVEPQATPFEVADVTDVEFAPPDGVSDRLSKRAGRFVVTAPDGAEILYGDNLRAETLRDLSGNEIRLTYDTAVDRLTTIRDTCGREGRLDYDDAGRLVHLLDRALDRHVWYGYDEGGRLNAVWKSVAAGQTPVLIAGYRYWGDGAPGDMAGNIVGLIDGRGNEILQLRYGDEPGFIWYDRVVEQRDGGVTLFDYEFVSDADEDDRINVAIVRCRMTLPSGDVQILEYNRFGRIVRLIVDDRDPLNPPQLVTRWRYNADGNVVREERADGSAVDYVYNRELFEALQDISAASIAERSAFGRLRRIVEYRAPGTTGPPTRVTEIDYDPRFGLISERRGPYYADILGVRIDPGPAWSQRAVFDARGKCVSVRVPDCTLPDGSTQQGPEIVFAYDARGRLRRRAIEAAPGQVLATESRYAPAPNLAAAPVAQISDADGNALEHVFTIDAGGRTTEALGPTGKRVVHVFDHLGRLQREETWLPGQTHAGTTLYEYGPLRLPLRKRLNRLDPNGVEEPGAELIEEFAFDVEGEIRASRMYSADGAVDQTVEYFRDPNRRLSAHLAGGVRFETDRNSRGLPIETRATAGGVVASRQRSRYDALGRLAVCIDEAGDQTEIAYDGFGRVARVRHPSGTEERFEWTARNSMMRHQVFGAHPDRTGAVLLAEEQQEHDEIGRVVRRTVLVFDPAVAGAVSMPATTAITYDRADRVVAITEPDGTQRTMQYDGLSRLIGEDDGVASTSTTTYDPAGTRSDEETVLTGTGATAPLTMTIRTRTEYDAEGRVRATTDALGNRWQWAFDSRGAVRRQIDPAGTRTEYEVGADGSLDATVNGAGVPEELRTTYRRDAMRRLVGTDGPRGTVMDLTRDAFGRPMTGTSGPESITTIYNAAGRAETLTDASGSTTRFEYRPGGLVSKVSVTAPPVGTVSARSGQMAEISFTYDGAGRVVRADDGANPVELRRDSRGLVLTERAFALASSWSYDVAGRVSAFVFPNGRRVTFDRGADGRLLTVSDTPPGATATDELLRVWTLGGSNIVDQAWRGATVRREQIDAAGRLLAIDEWDAAGSPILSLQQIADARGYPKARRLAVGTAAELTIATTDGHGRIAGVVFDPAALLDVAPIVAMGVTATQADLDTVSAAAAAAVSPGAEALALLLDADGARRRLRRRQGGATVEERLYDIDRLGRSIETGSGRVDDGEGLPMSDAGTVCRYDAFRRLSRVERNGALVAAIEYDALGRIARVATPQRATEMLYAGNALVETRSANQVIEQCVRLPGGPLIETGLPTAPRRALLDGQGSIVGFADETGAATAWAMRDPFGEARGSAGPWPEVGPRFQGLLGVDGLDLLLTDARSYNPRTGGFREIDPAGFPDGLSRGLFADGNPLAFCDPSGLMAQPADQTGRASNTPGVGGSYGSSMLAARPSDRPYNWAERDILAMAGAVVAVVEGFFQIGLMLYDLRNIAFDIGLRAIGFDINYQPQSSLGQMAMGGQVGGGLDVFRVMAKGLIETPGRLCDAMERDDPFDVGREAMNIYMVGKPALVGAVKTVFNGGVSALRIGGARGVSLNQKIRSWQVRRMQDTAQKLAGAQGSPPVQVRYVPKLKAESGGVTLAEYQPASRTILMSDAAFNPAFQLVNAANFLNPFAFGGSAMSRLGLMWGSVSRGNFALRSLTHEFFHHFQQSSNPWFARSTSGLSYLKDPMEFTQPGLKAPWPGAWNAELAVPRGPFPIGAFMGLQVGMNTAKEPPPGEP